MRNNGYNIEQSFRNNNYNVKKTPPLIRNYYNIPQLPQYCINNIYIIDMENKYKEVRNIGFIREG